ncbi:DUF5082 family protein [Enterococcus sp. BWM-S5]|uniref:DUF5082 family protein n=1 Tax=Enterococcus larvae TaxID=2794352 RepID=A0ABS4CFF7_9ENTE|nr:DUF5082 family protein [Enterococcus larvae]MBP1044997.1 DUF5082 family protein [Enterococcus larvae]
MAELGIREDRKAQAAKDAIKAQKRAQIMTQLTATQNRLTSLNIQKLSLEDKVQRLNTALTNIESSKSEFDTGKSSLDGITIESGSWKGENATKANTELEQMKTSVQDIGTKISDAITTLQDDKAKYEKELEQTVTDIATGNARVSTLLNQLNSL